MHFRHQFRTRLAQSLLWRNCMLVNISRARFSAADNIISRAAIQTFAPKYPSLDIKRQTIRSAKLRGQSRPSRPGFSNCLRPARCAAVSCSANPACKRRRHGQNRFRQGRTRRSASRSSSGSTRFPANIRGFFAMGELEDRRFTTAYQPYLGCNRPCPRAS